MTLKLALLAAVALTVATSTAVHAEDAIKIAINGPITGSTASMGEQMKRGAEMAVKDINAAGGVLGKRLDLMVGDDACDPKQAVAIANQAAKAGVLFVSGHFCSGSSIPAAAVYNEEGILQISPASTNPKLTELGFKNVFRVCGRDDQQGAVAGNYLATHYKTGSIAILNDKSSYGKGLADDTKRTLNAAGVQERLNEAYSAGEKDFTALVSKLKQARVEVVYVGGYHTEAGLIARQMRNQGLHARVIGGDAMVTNEYWAITGTAGEGSMMTFGPELRDKPEAKDVAKAFRASGYEPEGYTLYSYATVQIYAEAVKRAGGTDLEKVEEQLHARPFDTVMGKLSFNEKGDVTHPAYVFYQWHDGKYAEMAP
ncbi:MAG: branched-chain amino acid ABC transporter substrate-binding protein [Rhodospirillaceae bacterium]